MSQKLINMRLQKEEAGLDRQPIPNALVTRDGFLNFHFCLYDLEGQYANGLYHGLFELHQNYPFNAPKLYFYTPSGRFEINLPICTSFTNYHQETWTSAWNVRSLILATISFMYSEEPSYGCRSDPESVRKEYAQQSKAYNFKNPDFDRLFGEKLVKIQKITEEERAQLTGKASQQEQSREEKVENGAQVEEPEKPLVVNEEGEAEVELYAVEQQGQKKELQEVLIPKKAPNRRNEFGRVLFKGTIVVGLVGGIYFIYRLVA